MTSLDILTTDNIPILRDKLCRYLAEDGFSDEYRAECIAAIGAIDAALAENARTCAELQGALERWMDASNAEILRDCDGLAH